MIKVYILPVERIDNTDTVVGIEYIHGGLLIYDFERATLIQDTTPEENTALTALAIEVREPTPEEIAALEAIPPLPEPSPDYLRACELLTTSAPVITPPEMWELLRIFGKRLGYKLE